LQVKTCDVCGNDLGCTCADSFDYHCAVKEKSSLSVAPLGLIPLFRLPSASALG